MKCNFISPHRSDVRRVTHEPGRKDRLITDSGGLHTKTWIRSACMLSSLLLLSLYSFGTSINDGIKNQMNDQNHYDPGVIDFQHSLVLFNSVLLKLRLDNDLLPLPYTLKGNTNTSSKIKKVTSGTYMIYPDKTNVVPRLNPRTERLKIDLTEVPDVKCSRMAKGSKDAGHPNKTENFYGNQTLEIKQLTSLMINENRYSNSRYCQGSHPLCLSAAFQLIQNLTPQNNLLWPV